MILDRSREMRLLELLDEDPGLILLMKNKCITENMWKVAIEKEPELFKFHKNPSKELCRFAVAEDGRNLKYILDRNPEEVTDDLIHIAIQSYPGAILLIPPEWRTDSFKEEAFDLDPSLIREFPRVRSSYLKRKINENPAILQYVKYPSEDLICQALSKNPHVVSYIRNFTPRITALIKSRYPNMVPLIPALNEDRGGAVDGKDDSEEEGCQCPSQDKDSV